MNTKPTPEIMEKLKHVTSLHGQMQLLAILRDREGPNFDVNGTPGMRGPKY